MKAISIKEPWASMILGGKKTIETRKWSTKYRGSILLCASKNPKSHISGKAFAVAKVVDVRPMTRDDEKKACCEIYDGAYSWVLGEVKKIKPFDVKGQLGLFDIDYEGELTMKHFIAKKYLQYLAKSKTASFKTRVIKGLTLKSTNQHIPVGTDAVVKEFINDGEGMVVDISGVGSKKFRVSMAYKNFSGFTKPPGLKTMEKWMDSGVAKTVTGKRTEPDGYGSDGSPSWLLALGYI